MNMLDTVQVIDINYRMVDFHPVIQIFGARDDGVRRIYNVRGFYPYMYVEASDLDIVIEYAESLGYSAEVVKRFLPIGYQKEPKDLVRITVDNPILIRDLRNDVMKLPGVRAVYETDIPFKNRFMIDNSIHGMSWIKLSSSGYADVHEIEPVERDDSVMPRVMSIDIECMTDGKGLPTPDMFPVIIISLGFEPAYNGRETVVLVAKNMDCDRDDTIFCGDEAGMIAGLMDIIREYDPDIIAGYNSNLFDFPFLLERARRNGIMFSIARDGGPLIITDLPNGNSMVRAAGRVIVDVMNLIKSNFQLRQYNLATAARLVGMEKYDVSASEITEVWSNDINRLISYARQDARITLKLITSLGLIDKYIELARLTGVLLQDVISGGQSQIVESILMREYFKEQRVVPPKRGDDIDEDEQDIKGATVIDPVKGLINDIIVLDFKSLYPTIMIAHNICYTTIADTIADVKTLKTVVGTRFVDRSIKIGIIPRVLNHLLNERIRIKQLMKSATGSAKARYDAKQYALKILLNSFYGYSGYRRSRLYCADIASTVTGIGRHNLERTVERIESLNLTMPDGGDITLKVIYGDTDSVFVHVEPSINAELAERIGKRIAEYVTAYLPKPMELVYESYSPRGLFITKKRYALLLEDGRSMKIRGLETVRRDWCELTTKTLQRCLDCILIEGSVDKAVQHVNDIVRRLRFFDMLEEDVRRSMIEDLILTRKYTRPVELYKNKQPHTELIRKIVSRGGSVPNIGDRISFVIVREGRGFVDRSEDPEYVIKNNIPIDVDYYIHHQILPPVLRLLEMFGVTKNMLIGKYMSLNAGRRNTVQVRISEIE